MIKIINFSGIVIELKIKLEKIYDYVKLNNIK